MTLANIVGDVGTGKTLFTTFAAFKEREKPIYSNYNLRLDNYHELYPETLVKLKNNPTLVIIDEAYTWLESRTSGREINRYLSYILFQSRKRGIDIYLTDQLSGTIDTRFRQMLNFEIQSALSPNGFDYTLFKFARNAVYKPTKFIMPWSTAEKLFPLYDTYEFINPIDENMVANITTNKSELIHKVDDIVKDLIKRNPAKKYTIGVIQDYCLRNDIPSAYVKMIYNAIKASELNL